MSAEPLPDGYQDEAIGVYGDDPLGILSPDPDPAPPNYYPVHRPEPRQCTCPRPGRWALYVKHDTDPFDADPDHVCREPRPGIDWSEVGRGLAVWRRA